MPNYYLELTQWCKLYLYEYTLLCIWNYIETSNWNYKQAIVPNIQKYLRTHVVKFDQCACHHIKWVELANIRISPLNIWLETTNPKSPRKTCQRHMIERYENILKQTKWRHKLLPWSLDYVYFAKLCMTHNGV